MDMNRVRARATYKKLSKNWQIHMTTNRGDKILDWSPIPFFYPDGEMVVTGFRLVDKTNGKVLKEKLFDGDDVVVKPGDTLKLDLTKMVFVDSYCVKDLEYGGFRSIDDKWETT